MSVRFFVETFLQNKVELIKESQAQQQQEEIRAFVAGKKGFSPWKERKIVSLYLGTVETISLSFHEFRPDTDACWLLLLRTLYPSSAIVPMALTFASIPSFHTHTDSS